MQHVTVTHHHHHHHHHHHQGGQKTTLVCMPPLLILWSSQFALLFTFSQTSRMVSEVFYISKSKSYYMPGVIVRVKIHCYVYALLDFI